MPEYCPICGHADGCHNELGYCRVNRMAGGRGQCPCQGDAGDEQYFPERRISSTCIAPGCVTFVHWGGDQQQRLQCQLSRAGHKIHKAHHAVDREGVEWMWWTYGNDRSISRPADRPALDPRPAR